ncbi:DUF2255 family protein [Streptomyces sp. NBC_00582]|uniref:DUF2255 family protein n=1 Tax=Streptomyces sp. NBC_00582 TaxID=2975783 RepID=UPI002E7FEFB5|nr:DUF2255 family protein [Streptomyces sp. NBC_00582]WUB59440.1 DUF2255 family protein [Streptomyces sp. NBC_00582]
MTVWTGVTFAEVPDPGTNDRVDTAYRSEYGRFGGARVDPRAAARATTLRLLPG